MAAPDRDIFGDVWEGCHPFFKQVGNFIIRKVMVEVQRSLRYLIHYAVNFSNTIRNCSAILRGKGKGVKSSPSHFPVRSL
jgi:hypothetical protein